MVDGNRILALADDLTGALETGAKFAAAGVSCVAGLARQFDLAACWPDATVLVLDTESRHLDAGEAYSRTAALARLARANNVRLLYKKTDSTLRGPIASEFRALGDVFAGVPLLYVPAYPAMGRTVRGGVLYVNGVPVDETAFARDLLDPVRESSLTALLADAGTAAAVVRPSELGESSEAGIYVVDGETDGDVEVAAAFLARSAGWRLAAGPAALAGRLAVTLDLPRGAPPAWPRISSCVVVNGSMQEVSGGQTSHALQAGWPAATPDLVPRGWSVFTAAPRAGGLERARRMGGMVKDMVDRARPDALFIIGGDTAAAVLDALDAPPLYPVGEIAPGVPVSRAGKLTLITKAGGFGPVDLLVKVRDFFSGSR